MPMTQQERRDAQIELRVIAHNIETGEFSADLDELEPVHRRDLAQRLRAVAAELARGTEGQP